MKIFIGKGMGKLYGFIALVFVVIIAAIVGFEAFSNRNGEYYTSVKDNGDIHVRVRGDVGKEVALPKEFPADIIALYPDMTIFDVWLDFTPEMKPLDIVLEVTAENPQAVIDYYENEPESLLNPDYKVLVSDHNEYGLTIRVSEKDADEDMEYIFE